MILGIDFLLAAYSGFKVIEEVKFPPASYRKDDENRTIYVSSDIFQKIIEAHESNKESIYED